MTIDTASREARSSRKLKLLIEASFVLPAMGLHPHAVKPREGRHVHSS